MSQTGKLDPATRLSVDGGQPPPVAYVSHITFGTSVPSPISLAAGSCLRAGGDVREGRQMSEQMPMLVKREQASGQASVRQLESEVESLTGSAIAAVRAGLGAEYCAVVGVPPNQSAAADSCAGSSGGVSTDDARTVRRPICVAGQHVGNLVVTWPTEEAAIRSAESLGPIVEHLGDVISMRKALRSTIRAVDTFSGIAKRLHDHVGNPGGVLDLVVDQATDVFNTDMAWIALVDDRGEFLTPAVVRGWEDERFLDVSINLRSGIGGAAIAKHHPIVISDYRHDAPATDEVARRAVIDAGVVSLVCAPMFRDDEMIGALYVANRRRTKFSADDVGLLTALSAEAGLAIANRRLHAQVEEQRDLLEQSFVAHQELTAASLSGVGLEGIGASLSRLLGRAVTIEQSVCEPNVLRCGHEGGGPIDGDEGGTTQPIVAGRRQFGSITAHGLGELGPLQRKALEHGATVVALELMKEHAAIEAEDRVAGDLLQELLETDVSPSEAVRWRAKRQGLDLDRRHRVLILSNVANTGRPDVSLYDPALAALRSFVARRMGTPAEKPILVKRGDEIIVLAPVMDEDIKPLVVGLRKMAADLSSGGVVVGIGPIHESVAQSARLARACLAMARERDGGTSIISYEDLGPMRFLLDSHDRSVSMDMIQEVLGPIRDHDRTARTPLLETLRVYIASDGNQARTAAGLFISVSTLKYRLRKLESLLDESPSDPSLRFRLKLAFSLLEITELVPGR